MVRPSLVHLPIPLRGLQQAPLAYNLNSERTFPPKCCKWRDEIGILFTRISFSSPRTHETPLGVRLCYRNTHCKPPATAAHTSTNTPKRSEHRFCSYSAAHRRFSITGVACINTLPEPPPSDPPNRTFEPAFFATRSQQSSSHSTRTTKEET